MALFDQYLIVDWSSANAPKLGKDSIWIALARASGLEWVRNVATRLEAVALIRSVMQSALDAGERLFAGFDFAFGYPVGAAERIGGRKSWDAVWEKMAQSVDDNADNQSNTYQLAGELNEGAFPGAVDGPFWGHPHQHAGRYRGLGPKKPTHAFGTVKEYRLVERHHKSAKSLWQMTGAGVVAAQTMTGLKHLESLRRDQILGAQISVWPFETRFDEDLSKPITIAEIYPSLFDVQQREDEVKDAAQVRRVAEVFAAADQEDRFQSSLAAPKVLSAADRENVLREEGWIVSPPEAPKPALDYIRDPAEIYRRSFETIRAEANLSRVPKAMQGVAIRLIHACGMVDVLDDLAFSDDAFEAGRVALAKGAPIICDVEMVRHGIIQRNLDQNNPVLCAVADGAVRTLAQEQETTRSAAAMDHLIAHMDGAVLAIGNAPTALFRVLELIDEGRVKPALIVGMPVGFVGAVESKEALIEHASVPYITVRGRRGGSAMASATVNALAADLRGGL